MLRKKPDVTPDSDTLLKLYALLVLMVSPLPPVPVQGVDDLETETLMVEEYTLKNEKIKYDNKRY